MDKISIALATYNGEAYLREQLDSLYSQTRLPDEVIVSDDCSVDSTVAILNEYRQKYNLIYYVNDFNFGVNKNFENALKHTSGDYIILCDQDDVWLDNKIEVLYQLIKSKEKRGFPCVVCSGVICTDKDLRFRKKEIEGKIFDWKYNLYGGFTQGCTMIMNKAGLSKVLPLPSEHIFDAFMGLVINMTGDWYYTSMPLMLYRHHSKNVIAKEKSCFNISGIKRNLVPKGPLPFLLHSKRVDLMDYVHERFFSDFLPEKKALFEEIRLCKNLPKWAKIRLAVKFPNKNIFIKFKVVIAIVFFRS